MTKSVRIEVVDSNPSKHIAIEFWQKAVNDVPETKTNEVHLTSPAQMRELGLSQGMFLVVKEIDA